MQETCANCNDFPFVCLKPCQICESDLCQECSVKGNHVHLCEWLEECSNECAKCKRLGCSNCLSTCYECQNLQESEEMFCCDCAATLLRKSHCKRHRKRDVCAKHAAQDECSQCESEDSISARQDDMTF